MLEPRADGHGRDHRRERGRGRLELSEVGDQDERRHEEDPAPDTEHPGEHAGTDTGQHQLDQLGGHRTSSWTAITTRKAAKRRTRRRCAIRCWSHTPASTPATAGRPTVAALPQWTSPRTP